MNETRTIKIRLSTYRALKIRAAETGEKIMDLVERLVAEDRQKPVGSSVGSEGHGPSAQGVERREPTGI